MSIFWKYFRDTLAWPLIRVPGSLAALGEGIAKNLDTARTDILWLRNQFNPLTCEVEYLEYHGSSRGIYRFGLETDEQFRARVVQAYIFQVKGSRVLGMPEIFQLFGYNIIEVKSLRDEDPERWAEFRILIDPPASGYSFADYNLIAYMANDLKPARSKLASIGIKLPSFEREDPIYFGGALVLNPLITISEDET